MPLGVLASIWIEDEETVSLYDSSLGRAVLSRQRITLEERGVEETSNENPAAVSNKSFQKDTALRISSLSTDNVITVLSFTVKLPLFRCHFCGIGIMDYRCLAKCRKTTLKMKRLELISSWFIFYLLDNSDYIKDFYCG